MSYLEQERRQKNFQGVGANGKNNTKTQHHSASLYFMKIQREPRPPVDTHDPEVKEPNVFRLIKLETLAALFDQV